MSLNWQSNRHLSEFSTFGIGGPISLFTSVHTQEEMEEAFVFAHQNKLPFFILGKGSNCLFDDAGYDGIVLLNRIDFITWEGDHSVTAGAGTSFSLLGFKTATRGLQGLEFASGIPASIGGAVYMNAGANGRETKDSLSSVLYLHADGKREKFEKQDLPFAYRNSPFQKMKGAILSASFDLEIGPEARKRQKELIEKRQKTQPQREKSAGCIFRNPLEVTLSAGALIEQAGLKGFAIGGAKVSEMHANFLVNQGGATARDVLSLIEVVQKKVHEKSGVHLETEIKIVGCRG